MLLDGAGRVTHTCLRASYTETVGTGEPDSAEAS